MLKLTHANMGTTILVNPAYVTAIYESAKDLCTHIVTEVQVWPVKESLIDILTAVNKLNSAKTNKGVTND